MIGNGSSNTNGLSVDAPSAPGRVEAGTGWYNEPVYPGEGLYGYGTVADLFARAPDRGHRDTNIGTRNVSGGPSIPELAPRWEWNPDPVPVDRFGWRSPVDRFSSRSQSWNRNTRHGDARRQRQEQAARARTAERLGSTQLFGSSRQPGEEGHWTLDGSRVSVGPTPEEERRASGPVWARSGGGLITGFQEGGEVAAPSEGDSQDVGLWDYGKVSEVSGSDDGRDGNLVRDGNFVRESQLPKLAEQAVFSPDPEVSAAGRNFLTKDSRRSRRGKYGRPFLFGDGRSNRSGDQHFDNREGQAGHWTLDGVRVEAPGPVWARKEGGLVRRGFQEGGLASLLQEREAMMEAPPGMPVGAEISEEIVTGNGQEEKIAVFSEAKIALEGGHPNPNPVLERFVELFGIDALEKLRDIVRSGEGDGMSDSIPGRIDGEEEVALSEGEYVIPADAVSGMGNGSTDAGAEALRRMVDEVRIARTGSPAQAPAIDPRMLGLGAAPPMMARGGMVRGYQVGGPVGPLNIGNAPSFPAPQQSGPLPHSFSAPQQPGRLPHSFPMYPGLGAGGGMGFAQANPGLGAGGGRHSFPMYPGLGDRIGQQQQLDSAYQNFAGPQTPGRIGQQQQLDSAYQNFAGNASAPTFGWGNQQADQNRVPGWRRQTFR